MQKPQEITVSGDIVTLLDQVEEAIAALNQRRPFSRETERRIRTLFLPDRVTSTLNIEGIDVSRRQTLAVMDAMTVGAYSASGDKEIHNILQADEFVYEAAERGDTLTPLLVREINSFVLSGISEDAGNYRDKDVEITGASFMPPSCISVSPLVQELCEDFPGSDFINPIIQAAWCHNQFTFIHPFIDGNGREARLLQDFCLLRRKLYPVGISANKRDDYYRALQLADGGEWDDLVEMIALSQLSVISKIDTATREPERRQAWISQLAKAAADKKTGTQHKQYLVWHERMRRVKDAFSIASKEIDESSDVVGVTMRLFDDIDFDKWKKIAAYGAADRTWAFSLLFFLDGSPFYKIIAYYRRHKSLADDPHVEADDAIALAFTGQEARSMERPNFTVFEDPHIHLREVVFTPTDMLCYEQDIPSKNISATELMSVEDVVRKLFEDVFYRKAALGS